jgi:23S rRNA (uracil-5-)-methyltransferase RumA
MICEHFGICGGCTHLNITYEEELRLKEATVRELLAAFDIKVWEDIIPAPLPEGYRNKMEFAFGDGYRDGPLALGIRKRRSFYEVAVPSACVLIPGDFTIILDYVLAFCRASGETFYHRRRHTGTLRHLVLRRGAFTGELLVNVVTASGSRLEMDLLAEGVKGLSLGGEVAGVLHTVNDGVADTVKNENVRVVYGRDYYREKLLGLNFKIGAFSFFQTNPAGAEVLYAKVRDYAGAGHTVFDLYCGTGTIAQVLVENFKEVIGVELNPEAVQAAEENAGANNIHNCRFIAGDVWQITDTVNKRPGSIVVDPPRDGLHPKALLKITGMGAEKLVYVSCKPSSLARDMAVLVKQGYRPERAVCVDMFPRTGHVETVVLMVRE